jgi:hypothetical protein
MANFGEWLVANESAQQIVVIGPKRQRAVVVAVPNPSHSVDAEAQIIYGMDGLTVDKISEYEYRDFRGTIWTVDIAATNRLL